MKTLPILHSGLLLLAGASTVDAQPSRPARSELSATGQLERKSIQSEHNVSGLVDEVPQEGCADAHDICRPEGPTVGASGTQSETSIAVDSTGQHIVIGFNDFRGFSRDPLSLSGFIYSDDGGVTFVDGGQLPTPGNHTLGGQRFPQIYGDPDVKYLGGCNFIYASLLLDVAGQGLVGTLSIHRSTDCGHTWSDPIIVSPATNPSGKVDVNGDAVDFADKELIDVDPKTGRVLIGWSNFAATSVEISATYTDDILSANPTFSSRRIIANGLGSGSSVRFAGNGSRNAYITWERSVGVYTSRIAFSKSSDSGQTWSAPVDISPTFIVMDEMPGFDRNNEFPSLAVDKSPGPFSGNIYVVYSSNSSLDTADIAFQRSTDGGSSFSAPILLNSRPGNDRGQLFPFVTVDSTTGRVHVFFYDQGVDTSGDLTQVSYLYSDDGGTTWSSPVAIDRPFKAGLGNDTSQPNLGDYIQSVAQLGTFYSAYAITSPQRFTDGQPSTQLNTPDIGFSKITQGTVTLGVIAGPITSSDSGNDGALDPGETARVRLGVQNASTNLLHARILRGVTAVLSSSTAGVTVAQPVSPYPDLTPGSVSVNQTDFVVSLAPTFVPGTPIELRLAVTSAAGTATLLYTLTTGTLVRTTLLSENFDPTPPGRLPAGWISAHGAGANTVPWTSSNSFCGTSNKAFHQNADDGAGANQNSRWERLFSPAITIPGDAQFVEVEFDVCYDTENDTNLRVLAYDGFFLRVTDGTPGRASRSVLAEAFEEEFTTGGFRHYPKHLPRNDDPSYFPDMSAWAGDSGGYQHVRMKLPGMENSVVQFRFEYAQDAVGTCADIRPGHTCGVAIDNFLVRSVRSIAPLPANIVVVPQLSRDNSGNIVAALEIRNTGSNAAAGLRLTSSVLGTTAGVPSVTDPVTVSGGGSVTTTITFPGTAGSSGSPSVLRISGTYAGGTYNASLRVVIP